MSHGHRHFLARSWLGVFPQSLLESYNTLALEELVDGMDLPVEWGHERLDLNGTVDFAYVE